MLALTFVKMFGIIILSKICCKNCNLDLKEGRRWFGIFAMTEQGNHKYVLESLGGNYL